jgi:hypothetical protein
MSDRETGSHAVGVPDAALLACLDVAVTLRIAELQRMAPGQREEHRTLWAAAAVDVLAAGGASLLFRTPAHPATARYVAEPGTSGVFNHMARALAAAAFLPGGAAMFGRTWHATDPASGQGTPRIVNTRPL